MATVLQRLRTLQESDQPVLSAYVDTAPVRLIGLGHVIAFRDACAGLRAQIEASDPQRIGEFDKAVGRVEPYLLEVATGSPGLAIFDVAGELVVTPLPIRPLDHVAWSTRPRLAPLEEAVDDLERVAVLLLDSERSRIYTIAFGQIETRAQFADEVPGKQDTGDWFALSQKRYERHREDHVMRHVKRTVRTLMDELRERPFDRLFIGGPDEARSMLTGRLPRPLRARFAGTVNLPLFASDADVLKVALKAAEEAERRGELDAVTALINDAATAHVTMGRDATFDALHDRRVHLLVVASDLEVPGFECLTCGRLSTAFDRCPACGGETRAVDVREATTAAAAAQDARVEVVSGEAGTLLMEHGGLAARTRY
ncbi:MAG: hypothetical protein IT336_07225 [Thermomicrobiales bacterium]|nr:hypothetical protein [Thermomicrobiales bacterium]